MAKKSAVKKAPKKPAKKAAKKVAKRATKTAVEKSTKKAAKKTVKAEPEKNTWRYIRYIPKAIPAGRIVCHNGVIPETPDQSPGWNGFRAWLDDKAKSRKYFPCNCGWSGLPHHMPLAWLDDRKDCDARKFPRK